MLQNAPTRQAGHSRRKGLIALAVAISVTLGCQSTRQAAFRPSIPQPAFGQGSASSTGMPRMSYEADGAQIATPATGDLSSGVSRSPRQPNASPIQRLLRPSTPSDFDGLRMLEPYQSGKIPIVFVHGLNSDRSTWADMINNLRTVPWVNARYQFWYFQYPTGEPFLRSALTLREQARAVIGQLATQSSDPALARWF